MPKPRLPSSYRDAPPRPRRRLRWFVAYTNPKCEKRAAMCLASRGYETFLPTRTLIVPQFRRMVDVDRPLFPRYLFVGLRPGQSFWGFHNAQGVEGILKNNDMPVEAPKSAVEELWRVWASGAYDERKTTASGPLYALGEAVDVVAGPFASFPATIECVLSPETVEVLVRIFGQDNIVRVPVDQLKKAC